MHIQLTYTTAATAQRGDVQKGTTWSLVSKGHRLAVGGCTYTNRNAALRAMEVALGGSIEYLDAIPGARRRTPLALRRHGFSIKIRAVHH